MSTVDQVIAYGMTEIGKPYVYGDEGPNSFDCSGLMQWIFGKAGIKLPRTAAQQQDAVKPVSNPKPGDLVFWGDPAHHVGLYLGGGRMLAAPHTGAKVRVQDVYGSPTYGRVSGIGNGVVGTTISTVTSPISNVTSNIADSVLDAGKLLMISVGGVALVVAGLWLTVKGKK